MNQRQSKTDNFRLLNAAQRIWNWWRWEINTYSLEMCSIVSGFLYIDLDKRLQNANDQSGK